jgi:hypothetical protein
MRSHWTVSQQQNSFEFVHNLVNGQIRQYSLSLAAVAVPANGTLFVTLQDKNGLNLAVQPVVRHAWRET